LKKKKGKRGWPERTARDDYIIRIYGWGAMREQVRGYAVRFPPSFGAKHRYHRYFSLKKFGPAALGVARAFRDSVLAEHASAAPRRMGKTRRVSAFEAKPRKTNKSGTSGVCFNKGCWIGFYHPRPGVQVRRWYGVKKYTYEGARMLATAWRNQMIAKLRRKP
jgi:AP2 domain